MQALISALNPAIAILCAVNLLWHLRALAPMRALNAKLRHSGDIVAVCLSLTGMALLWESFTTQWMVLVHLNAILLAWDALTLLLKPFRGARKAHETLRALSRRGLAFLLGALGRVWHMEYDRRPPHGRGADHVQARWRRVRGADHGRASRRPRRR